jgi:hypothetical protein
MKWRGNDFSKKTRELFSGRKARESVEKALGEADLANHIPMYRR